MHVGRLLALLAMLAYGLAVVAASPSPAIAVSPSVDPSGSAVAMAGAARPGSIPVRQATPDLTAVKSNNVAGSVAAGAPWIWTVDIANGGTATATFTAGQIVFVDNLPNASVGYGTPTVSPPTGGASGPLTCEVDFTVRLTCVANGGAVSLPPGGAFRIAVSAVSATLGTFANPRAGGACTVDPNNTVAEGAGEANNACADTVTVRGPDLTVTKTNNVGGAADVGAPWTWTVTIANSGVVAASFASGQMVAVDNLPNTSVTYGTPTVTPVGGAGGPLACTVDFTVRLACVANGGVVTIPAGGSFRITLAATATVPGVYANPRAGGACQVDPNSAVVESNEGNNTCTDQVRVGPDLTAAKVNNVGGAADVGAPWTWTVTVTNAGTSAVTFSATQAVVFDHLPTNVTYGTPTVTPSGGASGPLVCTVDFTLRLACFAAGGAVTLPPGGSFQIAFTATAGAPAVFASPRAGQTCAVDPNGIIAESVETNNDCGDTVTVAYQGAQPAGVAGAAGSANDDGDDDEDDEPRLTETQRHQRSHTNASGQDDYRTEGTVLEVRCATSTEPQYEVSFPTHIPDLVIATRDGNQQLRLLYDTRSQCQATQVGDYAEADGDKEHELLFNAHNLTVRKSR